MADTSEDEQEGGSQHSEPDSVNNKRKTRGISKGLKKLKPGEVRTLKLDNQFFRFGDYAHDLRKHIGHICRNKVSILFEDWKDVPEGMKDSLWQDVKKEFNIDEDNEERLEKMKKVVLHKCDAAFRRFKCDLNTDYIKDDVDPEAEPACVKYQAIFTEEIWNEFVKIKITEKAKEISEKASKSRKKNKHPHTLGQSSYAQKEPAWLIKGYYNTPSSNSVGSSSSSGVVSSFLDRTISCVLARSKPDDEENLYVPNPETQKVKTKIDELRKKAANGDFVQKRSDDILAHALGTKERSAHVRGCVGYTGHKDYWGPSGRCYAMPPPGEFKAMIDKHFDEILGPIISKLVAAGLWSVDTNSLTTPYDSSCQSGGLDDPFTNPEGKHSYDLALKVGTEMVIVAEGTVHLDLVFNHHEPLLPGNVTVSVDRVREGYEDSQLPTTSKHINPLGLALSSFTQWPKNLVLLQSSKHDEVLISKKNNSKKHPVESGGHETHESATIRRKTFLLEKGIPCLTEKLTRNLYCLILGSYPSLILAL